MERVHRTQSGRLRFRVLVRCRRAGYRVLLARTGRPSLLRCRFTSRPSSLRLTSAAALIVSEISRGVERVRLGRHNGNYNPVPTVDKQVLAVNAQPEQ